MRTTSLCLLAGVALCSVAHAQRLASYDQGGALVGGVIAELQPPTPLLPAPLPPLVVYPTAPALPALPGPVAVAPGDSTFDNAVGLHWYTNGAIMAAMPTPTFAPLAPAPAPFPIPAAVLGAIGGGPVTGIALNPIGVGPLGPIMYLTGAPGIVIGVAPVPGMPVLVPAFPVPFLAGPITGLEWDGATGTLYACDAAGICYNFLPGGAPVAPPIVPPIGLPAPAGDVAIDKTLRPNPAGLRPLYVVAGPMVLDVNDPLPMPFASGLAAPQGLAFLDHPAANPPIGTCICPGTTFPTQFTRSVMSMGNAGFGIGMGGMPPGWPVLFVFDVAVFNPAFPWINTVGCGLGILLGSPSIVTFGGVADGLGNAMLPLPLVPPVFALGTGPFYNQNATLCPTDPALGLVITPMQTIYAAGF